MSDVKDTMKKGLALVLVQTVDLSEDDGIDRDSVEVMDLILPEVNGRPMKVSLTGLEAAKVMAAALRASSEAIFRRGANPVDAVLPVFPNSSIGGGR